MDIICEEYLPYDVTMFWEFFRWERRKKGHIYLQHFPNGKLYAGQTTQFTDRMNKYSNHYGSNPHHTNALNLYGWSNVCVLSIECPVYMLDTIEIFLISYYNLMNPDNGYNKTSGGRKNWYVSKETRAKMSVAHLGKTFDAAHRAKISDANLGKTLDTAHRAKISAANLGKTLDAAHRAKISAALSGVKNPNFGKPSSVETRDKLSITKIGDLNPNFGKPRSAETRAKISASNTGKKRPNNFSGSKSYAAKPICAFGIVYSCAIDASNALRHIYKLKSKNFISKWICYNQYADDIFKIHKEFYTYAITCELENITKDFYTTFMEICLW